MTQHVIIPACYTPPSCFDKVWWNDYYPDNTVVPRMTPEQWKERARAASNQGA